MYVWESMYLWSKGIILLWFINVQKLLSSALFLGQYTVECIECSWSQGAKEYKVRKLRGSYMKRGDESFELSFKPKMPWKKWLFAARAAHSSSLFALRLKKKFFLLWPVSLNHLPMIHIHSHTNTGHIALPKSVTIQAKWRRSTFWAGKAASLEGTYTYVCHMCKHDSCILYTKFLKCMLSCILV